MSTVVWRTTESINSWTFMVDAAGLRTPNDMLNLRPTTRVGERPLGHPPGAEADARDAVQEAGRCQGALCPSSAMYPRFGRSRRRMAANRDFGTLGPCSLR